MNVRVAVLLSGRGSNMTALVEGAKGYDVVLVASDRPAAAGLAWAGARGLATFALSTKGIGKPAFEAALDAALREARVEVIALAGFMRLLSADFVARWAGRIVNIHPSLLPLYKGLDTHARALAAGDTHAGCSVHIVTEELDGGRVLGQARVAVEAGDTAETLAARVLVAEHALYPRILSEFAMVVRVRDVALALPGAEAVESGFAVEGRMFAAVEGESLRVVGEDGWYTVAQDDAQRVEDAVARSWELTAPAHLLEAGGR